MRLELPSDRTVQAVAMKNGATACSDHEFPSMSQPPKSEDDNQNIFAVHNLKAKASPGAFSRPGPFRPCGLRTFLSRGMLPERFAAVHGLNLQRRRAPYTQSCRGSP